MCFLLEQSKVKYLIRFGKNFRDALTSVHVLNDGSPLSKIVNEYDQEIPQSQTADNPVAPRGRAAQSSQDTRKTN